MKKAIGIVALGVVLAVCATASAKPGSSTASTIKIQLPPAGQVKISKLVVKSSGLLTAVATNAAQLNTPAVNTQVVLAIKPKPSAKPTTYTVLVVIHHWPAARRAAGSRSGGSATGENFLDLAFDHGTKAAVISGYLEYVGCGYVREFGFLTDDFYGGGFTLERMIQSDTAAEEQLDGAIYLKCPGAEAPDPGGK